MFIDTPAMAMKADCTLDKLKATFQRRRAKKIGIRIFMEVDHDAT
jgi:hypothetical protein